MKSTRLLIALFAATLFLWGCGDDDPAQPKDNGPKSVLWTTPGGDFVATPSAALPVADVAPYRFGSTAMMVADVQSWVSTPSSDFGWLIRGDETSTPPTVKRFDTRESTNGADRPSLVVYHDGSGTPTTIPCVKDNTLVEDAQGDRSNGNGNYFFAGTTAEGVEDKRRGVIAFSVADSLSSSAVIDSVFLDLHMSKSTGHTQAFTVTVHKLTRNWGEGASTGPMGEGAGGPATAGDATWIHAIYQP